MSEDIINEKIKARLKKEKITTQNGAEGEANFSSIALKLFPEYKIVRRPVGAARKAFIEVTSELELDIPVTGFDFIGIPTKVNLPLNEKEVWTENILDMIFIEVKTSKQTRTKADFSNFLFSITHKEERVAEAVGPEKHRVVLVNSLTGVTCVTSIKELLLRAKSISRQITVQL